MHCKTLSVKKLNELLTILKLIKFNDIFNIISVSNKHLKMLYSHILDRCVEFKEKNLALAKYEFKALANVLVVLCRTLAPLRSIVYQVALQCFLLRAHHWLPF